MWKKIILIIIIVLALGLIGVGAVLAKKQADLEKAIENGSTERNENREDGKGRNETEEIEEVQIEGEPVLSNNVNLSDYLSNIIISEAGEYFLSGNFNNSVYIDSENPVILNLNGVNINSSSASIANVGTGELIINVVGGTSNTLSDGKEASSYDGCIFSNGQSGSDALASMINDINVNKNDSFAKSLVEAWYEDTMTEYTSKLEDTIYCNNRIASTPGGWDAAGELTTHLKFYSFDNNDLTCGSVSDRFTVSSSIGNGKLRYSVGMITAPEAKLWGSSVSGSSYWSMSPFGYGEAAAHVFKVWDNGVVDFDRVTYSNGIRPVVSLKPGTEVSGGNGTVETPYIIE